MRLFTAVLGAMFLAQSAAARLPSEPPPVARSSDVIRAVLAQPITSDPLPLLVAAEKLRMAKDERAANAIDAYLTAAAVRQVFGETAEMKGTVADIVEGRVGTPPIEALVRRLLEGTLRAELAAEPLRHSPDSGLLELPVMIRNVTHRVVTAADFRLKVGLQPGPALTMYCDDGSRPIASKSASPRICTSNSQIIKRDHLDGVAKQANALAVAVSRLQFQEPDLAVDSGRVIWINSLGRQPYDQAFAELEALDCSKRGTCLREAMPSLEGNPMAYFAAVFAFAGLAAGTLIALFARRRWRWGLGLAGLVAGCILSAFVLAMMANSNVGLLLMILGPAAAGAFLLGIIPPLAVIKGRHPE